MKKHTATPKRLTAFLAALALTAGMPAIAQKSTVFTAPLTAYADDDEPYTEGSNDQFYYNKYSNRIVITGGKSSNMQSLTIPDTIDGLPVTEIGIYAFQFCDFSSLTLPDSITFIDHYAFGYCKNLTSVTLPASLKKTGLRIFESCPALSEVNFPDHLIEFGELAFEDTAWLNAQRQKDPLVIVNGALIDGRSCKGDVKVPSGVKFVSGSAFSKNENITSVVFPASVSAIKESTFWYCSNLTSVELNGCTSLGFGVFAACNKLTDLKLSGKLTSIDSYTFCDNNATATITFYGSESTWNNVQKPANDPFLSRARMVFDESHVIPGDEVAGDINADGKCDRADAVLLQKYLLTTGTLTADQAKIADMNGDNKLTGADLTRLKAAALSAN